MISAKAIQAANSVGISVPRLAVHALDHINTLLPGPPVAISISYAPAKDLNPPVGTFGVTDCAADQIQVAFGLTPQASLTKALLHLPRTLSHEVDHTVRCIDSPGDYISTLLQQIISEGISSVFDQAAFPGPPDPWDQAISKSQECTMWKKAQPLLGEAGLYNQWFFGGAGVPDLTGFTIGYHIVADYHRRHPNVSWAGLTGTPAATILAGSHYRPCSH